MTREADRPVVSLQHAVKKFGSFTAMSDGCIELYPHRIHALAGENGAGKSTLVKVLAGIHQPNSGEFLVDGQPVRFKTPAESKGAGISVIYQEPTLFPDLTVAENIYVGRQPRGRFGFIDHAAMRRDAQELFDRLEVPIDPSQLADGLSIADQQIIEIAKAISLDAKVLIMDEPTAALSGHEVDRLFSVARSLRDKGASLMFISHRMEEIFDLCDDVTIMRDGAYVSTRDLKETTKAQLVRDMVGRDVDQLFPKLDAHIGDPVLTVEGLTRYGAFEDVSFEVRSGEILGLAGLVGAGRSEVVRTIMGIDKADGGTVTAFGKPLKLGDTVGAIRAGLAFVPEDRRKQGLVMDLSVARNTALTLRSKLARCGLTHRASGRAGMVHQPRSEDGQPGHPRIRAVGRQSAKGRPGEMARHRPDDPHRRRADPRHRRGNEGRSTPPDLHPGHQGSGRHHDLLRAARNPRHGRPRPRHVRRTHHRRIHQRRSHS